MGTRRVGFDFELDIKQTRGLQPHEVGEVAGNAGLDIITSIGANIAYAVRLSGGYYPLGIGLDEYVAQNRKAVYTKFDKAYKEYINAEK
jgi:hypothetical protein